MLSALTSAQFIVIPVASYFMLGEAVTLTTLACIAVVLFGAPPARQTCKVPRAAIWRLQSNSPQERVHGVWLL